MEIDGIDFSEYLNRPVRVLGTKETLRGEDKESYLDKLIDSVDILTSRLNETGYKTQITDFMHRVANLFDQLRIVDNKEDYHDNTGIIETIKVYKKTGMPEYETIMSLYEKRDNAEQYLRDLFDHDPRRLFEQAILETVFDKDQDQNDAIRKTQEKYRSIKFYHHLEKALIPELTDGERFQNELQIQFLGEDDQVEHFGVTYAGYDMTEERWIVYYMELHDDKSKTFFRGREKPGHIYPREISKEGYVNKNRCEWDVSSELARVLKSNFAMFEKDMYEEINELNGIQATYVSLSAIRAFHNKHSVKGGLGKILDDHPQAYILSFLHQYVQEAQEDRKDEGRYDRKDSPETPKLKSEKEEIYITHPSIKADFHIYVSQLTDMEDIKIY